MSIAISVKVNDGVVLAADSASTILLRTPQGEVGAVKVYNNANKIFNLYKGLPIGCVTFGAGSIGNASIATLIKDFRHAITLGPDEIQKDSYQVEDITHRMAAFLRNAMRIAGVSNSPLGVIVCGYSSGGRLAEEWSLELSGAESVEVSKVREADECGLRWGGEAESLHRLVVGFSPVVEDTITKVAADRSAVAGMMNLVRQRALAPLIHPAMPIQDAIDLARFLVEVAVSFSRFTPGAPIVGGPVEIAAITKHECFKWVTRKHYWDVEYNRGWSHDLHD